MSPYQTEKETLLAAAQLLTHQGYLMATGGNLSLRISTANAFAVTPSNLDYLNMNPEDICILNLDGRLIEGTRKPSVEASMHAAIYQVRLDVQAIIHTHQVYASALTLIKKPIPALFDEQARFLGRKITIIPYAPSGTGMLKSSVAKHVRSQNNAYMMQNHGALVFGHDMERAIHNVEILEKCALAYLLALCTEQQVSKIPLAVREIAFSKLRKDQKNAVQATRSTSGE